MHSSPSPSSPFLSLPRLPTEAKSFLRFDYTPEEIPIAVETLLGESREYLASLVASFATADEQAPAVTFEKFCCPFDRHIGILRARLGCFLVLQFASPQQGVRRASLGVWGTISAYWIEVFSRKDLFELFLLVETSCPADSLSFVERRYLSTLLLDFRRNGVEVDMMQRQQRIEEQKMKGRGNGEGEGEEETHNSEPKTEEPETALSLKLKCKKLEKEFLFGCFGEMMKTSLLFHPEKDLEGCEESWIAGLEREEEGENRRVKMSLKTLDRDNVLLYCTNAETRRKLTLASEKCGVASRNSERFVQLTEARQKFARMLGYADYPAYRLEIAMADTVSEVREFHETLQKWLRPKAETELREMRKLKREEEQQQSQCQTEEEEGEDDGPTQITSSEWRFYLNALRVQSLGWDEKVMPEYFPLERVLKTMLDTFASLFGVEFVQIISHEEDIPVYCDEVRVFNVVEEGEVIGRMYLDLFMRDGKFGYYMVEVLQDSLTLESGKRLMPAAVYLTNFPRPTSEFPSLLNTKHIKFMFHEFGHLLHAMFNRSPFSRFGQTLVERDFLEFPSQLMEYFPYHPAVLSQMTEHYLTSEPLPESLKEKFVQNRRFGLGLNWLLEVFTGTFDVECFYEEDMDTRELYHRLRRQIALVPAEDESIDGAAGFAITAVQYECAYYSYLWGRARCLDVYSTLFEPLNTIEEMKEVAMRYKRTILEMGAMRDGRDMLRELLGRPPNLDAMKRELKEENLQEK